MGEEEAPPPSGFLVPSQAVSSSIHENNNDARKSRRQNRRNNRKEKMKSKSSATATPGDAANDNSNTNGGDSQAVDDNAKRRRNRRRIRKKKSDNDNGTGNRNGGNSNADTDGAEDANVKDVSSNAKEQQSNNDPKKKQDDQRRKQKQKERQKQKLQKLKEKQKRKKNEKKYPWRKLIPPGTVDPISLEPLDTLPYPPFALMIDGSTPIPIWPIPNGIEDGANNDAKNKGNRKKDNENGDEKTKTVSVSSSTSDKMVKQREEQLLSEQWGDLNLHLLSKSKTNGGNGDKTIVEDLPSATHTKQEEEEKCQTTTIASTTSGSKPDPKAQHFHLFDGKVLAFYLVSELQFIDPLNRRDLTRDEVANLDAYLKRHQLKKMAVLDAYDEKGLSVSTAGAMGQTREGRLRMRQEQARQLLNSLFNGDNNGNAPNANTNANVESRRNRRGGRRRNNDNDNRENLPNENLGVFQSMPQQQGNQNHTHSQSQPFGAIDWMQEEGIYAHDDGGMIIIDDDLNPGLRGRGLDQVPGTEASTYNNHQQQQVQGAGGASWASASGALATRYGYNARNRVDAFPALSATVTQTDTSTTTNSTAENGATKPTKLAKTSKSLSKIGNLVKKTNPKEVEKQRKAREAALRQAEIANMPFEEVMRRMKMGDNTPSDSSNGLMTVPPTAQTTMVTEGQLERNRKIASALGVAPTTVRAKQLNSGWARPTSIPSELDEFGNELNTTQYPDELIIQAREQMTELLRLEKKWTSFLKDDKAASCPLKPMVRPIRKFVHAYSDFWNLHTQSFDPEPNRYIHCVKLLETRAPRPLLSQAVRSWRGPTVPPPSILLSEKPSATTHSGQTAGEDTASSGRHLPLEDERTPLNLAPRTVAPTGIAAPLGAMFDMAVMELPIDAAATASNSSNHNKGPASASQEAAPRFAPMLAERERPRLNLDPRTKPLELPKYEPPPSTRAEELEKNRILKRNAIIEREKAEEEKKRNILAAAFASDDEEDDSESEWEVEEAVYSGSDSEEDE